MTVDKFIPYKKLSKKARRKIDLMSRRGWNGLDPVTRVKESGTKYTRKQKHPESSGGVRIK